MLGARHLTLLAFLSSGCSTCHGFWDAWHDDAPVDVPGDARLVDRHQGPERGECHRASIGSRPAPFLSSCRTRHGRPTTCRSHRSSCSSTAPSATIVGEGAASNWDQVRSLLQNALADAGLVDRHGRTKRGGVSKPRADVLREARVDRELLTAGIVPGDPEPLRAPRRRLRQSRRTRFDPGRHAGRHGRACRRASRGAPSAVARAHPTADHGPGARSRRRCPFVDAREGPRDRPRRDRPPPTGGRRFRQQRRRHPRNRRRVRCRVRVRRRGCEHRPVRPARRSHTSLEFEAFSPTLLQRSIKGQSGAQRFFTEAEPRRSACTRCSAPTPAEPPSSSKVNTLLATLRIEPLAPAAEPCPAHTAAEHRHHTTVPLGTVADVVAAPGRSARPSTSLLDTTGLRAVIAGTGPFTVFAPSDPTFAAIDLDSAARRPRRGCGARSSITSSRDDLHVDALEARNSSCRRLPGPASRSARSSATRSPSTRPRSYAPISTRTTAWCTSSIVCSSRQDERARGPLLDRVRAARRSAAC